MKIKSAIPKLSFLFILSVVLLMSGCVKKNTGTAPEPAPATLGVSDYFPIEENVQYLYEGIGNEYATYTLWNDYTSADKVQQRIDNGGTITAKILEIKNGQLIKLASQEEMYYRENMLDIVPTDSEVLLMEPVAAGTRWTLADGRIRSILSTEVNISVPFGEFTAVQVVTEDPNQANSTVTDYYVKDIGLVKTVFRMDETEISSSLKGIVKNTALTQSISFYYPNVDEENYTPIPKEVSFKTNDETGMALAAAYKESPADGLASVFSPNTEIQSLSLNKDGKVLIDLNAAFTSEMNAGSGYEGMILQSIANTFGAYYNHASQVILTVDGKPYSSGHYYFIEGEGIQPLYDNAD